MTDKPGAGRTLYKQEIVRGRNAAREARKALSRILNEQPGPAMTNMLLAAAALSLGEIESVLSRLDENGREAKNLKD